MAIVNRFRRSRAVSGRQVSTTSGFDLNNKVPNTVVQSRHSGNEKFYWCPLAATRLKGRVKIIVFRRPLFSRSDLPDGDLPMATHRQACAIRSEGDDAVNMLGGHRPEQLARSCIPHFYRGPLIFA